MTYELGPEENDKETYPRMIGVGEMEATQEIHIFLGPVNPSVEEVERYYQVTQEWNETVLPTMKDKGIHMEPMKPCYLALIFRKDGEDTEVCVMQSARYVRSNDPAFVVEQCHQDAQWFRDHDFEVLREKIEATAHGIEGIPQTDVEAVELGKYFEFHFKLRRKDRDDTSPHTEEETNELKALSVELSREYGIPVPLSYNKNKDKINLDGQGHQRFMNKRYRGRGWLTIKPQIDAMVKQINNKTSFEVVKIIREWVWFDTLTEMDHGWIDFGPGEFQKAYLLENEDDEHWTKIEWDRVFVMHLFVFVMAILATFLYSMFRE